MLKNGKSYMFSINEDWIMFKKIEDVENGQHFTYRTISTNCDVWLNEFDGSCDYYKLPELVDILYGCE